jgi:hypothetical protein
MLRKFYVKTPLNGDKLITIDALELMFIQIADYLNDQLKKYPEWNIGLYSDTKWFLCSCSTSNDEVIKVTYSERDTAKCRAEQMLSALWVKNYPLHTKVKELQGQASMCASFLGTFLVERQLKILESPNECYGCPLKHNTPADIPGYCDYCRGLFYPTNQNIQNLLYDFFKIDKEALKIERDRILKGLKA